MSVNSDIRDEVFTLVDGVTGVENVYKRRATYENSAAFKNLFRVAAKNRYLGFTIARVSRTSLLTAFSNKIRDTYSISIVGLIGVEDDGANISYTILDDLMVEIGDVLNLNLTLNAKVTDAEFAEVGALDLDSAVGNTIWTGEIIMMYHKDRIVGSID